VCNSVAGCAGVANPTPEELSFGGCTGIPMTLPSVPQSSLESQET
jgi:hypothetical protein